MAMSRSTRSRPPQFVSLPQRVARRWREGVVVSNLGVAGYLAQLPRIEQAIFGPGMLTTVGIGVGAGLTWMLLRGALSSGYDFRKLDPVDDVDLPPRRSPSAQRVAAASASVRPASEHIRTISPDAPAPAPRASAPRSHAEDPRASAQPTAARASQPLPAPAPRAASQAPYVQPQTGETIGGYPSAYAADLSEHAPEAAARGASASDSRPFEPHVNQSGATLHGWSSSPPAGSAPPSAYGSIPPAGSSSANGPWTSPRSNAFAHARPEALAATQFDAFGGAHGSAATARPSGPPTARMTALQEAELAASPDAARASERPDPHASARLSWPPEVELTTPARASSREGSRVSRAEEPRASAPMGVLSRAVSSPAPANDAVLATYIDTVGEPAHTLGESHRPEAEPQQRSALSRRVAARVEVIQAEANPSESSLAPELLDQLEELRADVLTMSPNHCFVVGVSSDAEHGDTKSALAVRLALQLAQSGSRRILLIEANATRPMLDRALELYVPLAAGFSQQMHRRMTAVSPTWTVLRVAPSLDVLAEGRFRTPGMLYGSVFAVALHELRDHYDVIVADGPVVETSEAAATFAQVVDGIGYVTSSLPSIRVPRERALARFKDKALFRVLTTR